MSMPRIARLEMTVALHAFLATRHSPLAAIFHPSFSASFTAFAAGNRILSTAPQNHHAPHTAGSDCGTPSWIVFSPAALTLLGVPSPSLIIENPASWHALPTDSASAIRSEEHTSELQSLTNLVCRLLLEKKN